MIQRIQTLYLLIGAILYSLLFFIPLNEMLAGGHLLELSINGLVEICSDKIDPIIDLYPLLILTSVSILLLTITIFLFKNRKLQMRLSIYSTIIGLGITFLIFFYTYQIASTNQIQMGFSIGMLIPLSSSILSFLAYRAIKKDDELVKSIDRIR